LRELLGRPDVGARRLVAPPGRAAAFSPDGRVLASGMENGVVGWEPETGREVFRLTCPPAALPGQSGLTSDVQFSPDGSALAANQAGMLNVWGLEDRALRARFGDQKAGLAGVAGFAFFPVGDRIVTSENEVMTVRDARTGRVLFTVPALRARAERLAFLPGGTALSATAARAGRPSGCGIRTLGGRFSNSRSRAAGSTSPSAPTGAGSRWVALTGSCASGRPRAIRRGTEERRGGGSAQPELESQKEPGRGGALGEGRREGEVAGRDRPSRSPRPAH